MSEQIKFAKITGYSLILMALIACYTFGFAYTNFFDANQPEATKLITTDNSILYKSMLIGITLIIILDLVVSYTIFKYFRKDNIQLAFFAFILRLVYTLVFSYGTIFLVQNNEVQVKNNLFIMRNYQSFEKIWSIGLVIFGIHLLYVGKLMKLHLRIPKPIVYLTIAAGASYILVHILKIALPNSTAVTTTLNNVLALPMALGELGIAIWLISKGGRIQIQDIGY